MRPEPFLLERFFAEHEFSARHLLSTSDCQGLELAYVLELADCELRQRWERLTLGYSESQGLPELREQVAAGYDSVSTDEVLVAAPEEAVFLAMNALLDPGDRVVCTFPGYQSLYQLALSLGCEVVFWEPRETGERWRFAAADLERLLREKTKLIVWNFPHNPTGALPAPADYDQILRLAAGSGAWVFSDEMYRLLELSPHRLPAAVDRYERAVSLAGMSKSFGLAGLRLGWIATHDQALMRAMAGLKDYTTICPPVPSEILALIALRDPEPILQMHRARVTANIARADGLFARHSAFLGWIPPQAGTVCFPRLSVPEGAEAFCTRVLRDTGVLLLPSTVYGYGDAHFRMGLGREDFATGLEALDGYLAGEGATPR